MTQYAKTTVPRHGRVFLREPQFARLDADRDASISWVTGLPGAGKTTLVESYLRARRQKAIWLRLDTGDEESANFFYFLRAATVSAKSLHKELPRLEQVPAAKSAAFARIFLRQFFAHVPANTVLVLDDFHNLDASAAIHDDLANSFEEIPAGGRVIVISRVQAPPAYSKLQLQGSLRLWAPDELRIADHEIVPLLAARSNDKNANDTSALGELGPDKRALDMNAPDIDVDRIKRIARWSGGWLAGIMLLAEPGQAQAMPQTASNGVEFTPAVPQKMFDYLAAEIYRKLPLAEQKVLKSLAFVSDISAELAVDLSGDPKGGRILKALGKKNYFVSGDSSNQERYNLHPLLQSFLQQTLTDELHDDTLVEHKRSVGMVLAKHQLFEPAFELLAAAQAYEPLAQLLVAHVDALGFAGRHALIRRYLLSMPKHVLLKHPVLDWWQYKSLEWADPAAARLGFGQVYERHSQSGDQEFLMLICSDIVQVIIGDTNAIASDMRVWVDRLDAYLDKDPTFSTLDVELPIIGYWTIGLSHLMRHNPKQDRIEQRMFEIIPHVANRTRAFRLYYSRAVHRLFLGRCGEAKRLLSLGPKPNPADLYSYPMYHATQVLSAHAHSDFEQCLSWISEAETFFERYGELLSNSHTYVWPVPSMACCTHLILGNEAEIERYLALWKQGKHALDRQVQIACLFHASALARLRKDARLSLHYAEQLLAFKPDEMVTNLRIWVYLGIVEAAILSENMALAQSLTHQWYERYRQTNLRSMYDADWLLCHAYLKLRANDDSQADDLLAQSWQALMQAGQPRPVISPSPVIMSQLCDRSLRQGIQVQFVRTLIDRMKLQAPPNASEHWPWPVRIRTLGLFAIHINGQPLSFGRKAPKKPLHLLKALISLGGRAVPVTQLQDLIWPDEDGDSANNAFVMALLRLRKLLVHDNVVILEDSCLSLNPKVCRVDALCDDGELVEGAGEFLAQDYDLAWTAAMRQRLRSQLTSHSPAASSH
jgi:LuxR family transcriptional regulator, maltose regulon positive regulatory protein